MRRTRRRHRNPSALTWISLGVGALVGYGVYRAVTSSATPTPPLQQTTATNAGTQNLQTEVSAGQGIQNVFGG